MRLSLSVLAAAALAVAGFAATASGGHPSGLRLSSALRFPNHSPARVLSPKRGSANSAVFTDPAGDSGSGPDITTINVSNDDAGKVAWQITLANRTSLSAQDGIVLFMDTDGNISNGVKGFDYALVISGAGNAFLSGASGSFQQTTAPSFSASFSGGVVTFSVNKADISNPAEIHFYVESTADGGNTISDDAPDGSGVYTFQVIIASAPPPPPPPPPPAKPPKFVVQAVGVPRAGKHFAVRASLAGLTVAPSLACTAKVGTRPVKTTVHQGVLLAVCALTVPARTTGKTLVVVLKIHFFSAGTTRRLSFKIK